MFGSNPSVNIRGLLQVTLGKHRGTSQLGSTLRFPLQWECCLVSGGKNPEVLSDTHHAFIIEPFFRICTIELMVLDGTGFQMFFKGVLNKPLVGYITTDRSLFVIYMSSVFLSLSQTQGIM